MSKFSHQKEWLKLRDDLEAKLGKVIENYIAAGAFDRVALRAFAREVSRIEHDLSHLDVLEAKKMAIHG